MSASQLPQGANPLVDTGAWTSYTPSNTNVTVGNGTQTAAYRRVGRDITVRYDLLWGSTTAFSGAPGFGIPVAAVSGTSGARVGTGVAYVLDSGTQDYAFGAFVASAGTTVSIRRDSGGGIDATTPFTWTTNDRISFVLTYEAAA